MRSDKAESLLLHTRWARCEMSDTGISMLDFDHKRRMIVVPNDMREALLRDQNRLFDNQKEDVPK